MKKCASGLIIRTTLKNGKGAIILQVRKKSDSWGGACQVTCHGKKLPDEDFYSCVIREAAEELGEKLGQEIASCTFIELTHLDTPEKEVYTFGIYLDLETFEKNLAAGEEVGGFKYVEDPSAIRTLQPHEKASGVPENDIAMFPDELEAVKKAFALFPH